MSALKKLNKRLEINTQSIQSVRSCYPSRGYEHEVIFSILALPLLLKINCRPIPPAAGAAGQSTIVPDCMAPLVSIVMPCESKEMQLLTFALPEKLYPVCNEGMACMRSSPPSLLASLSRSEKIIQPWFQLPELVQLDPSELVQTTTLPFLLIASERAREKFDSI